MVEIGKIIENQKAKNCIGKDIKACGHFNAIRGEINKTNKRKIIEICEKLKIRNPRTKLKEIGKLKDNKMSLGIKL